uniref:RNase H type-1 domain-containing protein n=1 Tax=Trichogramma kaykai TaxID=54128 RepID=A0ABD2W7M3_9HYME
MPARLFEFDDKFVTIDKTQIVELSKKTILQSKSQLWHESRQPRISASTRVYMIKSKRKTDKNNIKVALHLVPSHVGIQGNEKADTISKAAATNGPILDKPIPVSDQYAIDLSSEQGTFYFQNFYSDSPKPWFKSTGMPRKATVSMNRIRSNHLSLNSSLF